MQYAFVWLKDAIQICTFRNYHGELHNFPHCQYSNLQFLKIAPTQWGSAVALSHLLVLYLSNVWVYCVHLLICTVWWSEGVYCELQFHSNVCQPVPLQGSSLLCFVCLTLNFAFIKNRNTRTSQSCVCMCVCLCVSICMSAPPLWPQTPPHSFVILSRLWISCNSFFCPGCFVSYLISCRLNVEARTL